MTNQIITGDCIDAMSQIETGTVDLIVTSPPYPGQKNDRRSVDEWLTWFCRVSREMYRVLSPVGVAAVNVMFKRTAEGWFDGRLFTEFPCVIEAAGFNWIDTYPFIKMNPAPNGPNGDGAYCDMPAWEPVFVFTKARRVTDYHFDFVRRPYKPKSMAKDGTVYSTRAAGIQPHPAGAKQPNYLLVSTSGSSRTRMPRAKGQSFPIEVPERFILQHTRPGDLVLDPFAGVGTTCRVAQINGRHYIGIEILEHEAEKAREWLKRPFQQPILQVVHL